MTTRTLVLHAGALGDHILIWPLLRALARSDSALTIACRASHGALARQTLAEPIDILDIEHPRFSRLWAGESARDDELVADLIISFLTHTDDPVGARWHAAARAAFGARESLFIDHPSTPSRRNAWARFNVAAHMHPALRTNPAGPILLHVGAGSHDKRWPLERWVALRDALETHTQPALLVAGEVELHRFSGAERRAFAAARGDFIHALLDLARALESARLFIAADTGPAHLAAQLGVPTLALFGPTDPGIWSPVGPRVRVVAPPAAAPMHWLSAALALDHARAMLIAL